MRLLPSRHFVVRLADQPERLQARLRLHIEPQSPGAYLRAHREFWGRADAKGFEIRRIGATRNSFRPVAYGRFDVDSEGTLLSVDIRLPTLFLPAILALTAVFLIFSLPSFGVVLSAALQRDLRGVLAFPRGCIDAFFIISPAAALALGIALAWFFFPAEANALQASLARALEG